MVALLKEGTQGGEVSPRRGNNKTRWFFSTSWNGKKVVALRFFCLKKNVMLVTRSSQDATISYSQQQKKVGAFLLLAVWVR